jgi:hypothetical protein
MQLPLANDDECFEISNHVPLIRLINMLESIGFTRGHSLTTGESFWIEMTPSL